MRYAVYERSRDTEGIFFFSSRRRHTRSLCDWSSDVCSSDLGAAPGGQADARKLRRARFADPVECGSDATLRGDHVDRKSTRLNSSHTVISYAVFCLKKKKKKTNTSLASDKIANAVAIVLSLR